MSNAFIRPYRIIPFDIGGDISCEECEKIVEEYNAVAEDKIQIQPIDKFHRSLSDKLICGYKINDSLLLFIYSYGVGVFSVMDSDFLFDGMESKYAIDYCKSRRVQHENFLNFKADASPLIKKFTSLFRTYYIKHHSIVRKSASAQWENNGLSYVMTVSYINTGNDKNNYSDLSDIGKHSLQIMLTPSLAHEEDSEIIKLLDIDKVNDPYDIDLDTLTEPQNMWASTNADIYISWASVIVIQNEIQPGYIGLINSLEVSLQAMWFYTYCLYKDLIDSHENKKILASALKRTENNYEQLFNEFLSNNDTSCPQYISDIKNKLVKTSGFIEEHDKYITQIHYRIEEIEAFEKEHQRKFAWLNESLLFIIAYVDIITTLTTTFFGDFSNAGQIVFTIAAAFIFILGLTFIVKKG